LHNFVHVNPLAPIKTDSYCGIRSTSVETSFRKVLHSTLCMYVIPQSFVSLTIFDIVLYLLYIIDGHYSVVLRVLLYGTSYYLIEEGMEPNIIHVCDLSIIFQFINMLSSTIFLH
jgi:hypothetical protein